MWSVLDSLMDNKSIVKELVERVSRLEHQVQRTRTRSLTDKPLQEVKTAIEAASLIASSEKVTRA
jgi:hypothetical protein